LHLSAIERPAHNADFKMSGDEHQLVFHAHYMPHVIEDLLSSKYDLTGMADDCCLLHKVSDSE